MFHQMCICSGLYSPREHFHFNISSPVFFWTLWWCPSYRLSDLVVCATLFSFAFDVVNFDVVNGGLNTLSFWALLFWGAGFLILLCHLCVSILVLQAAAFTMLFVAAKKESVHPSCISDTLWRNLKVCCGKGPFFVLTLCLALTFVEWQLPVEFLENVFDLYYGGQM